MSLTEAEELELLELENRNAFVQGQQQGQDNTNLPSNALDVAKQAINAAVQTGPVNLTKNFFQTDPAIMQKYGGVALPIAGGVVGAPFGLSAPGAAVGELIRQMTGTALNPSTVPQTAFGRAASVVGAGVAQDPKILNAIPGVPQTVEKIGEMAGSAGQSLKTGFSKFGQALTGKSAVKFRQLMEDPSAILPESLGGAKSVEKASQEYGQALEASGMTKRLYGPFSKGKSEADTLGNSIYTKWKNGNPISAQEAFDAKRATDKVWPSVVKERNAEDIRELSTFKTAMDDILSSQQGQFQKASKDYARARLGADFTQFLPRTKTGDISTVKTLLLHTLAPGRNVGLVAGGLTSPAVVGGLTAGTVGAGRGLNVLAQNPQIRQILLNVLQQLRGQNGQ